MTIRCHESLLGVFFDRFGTSLVTREVSGGFELSLLVVTSPMFFSWLMSFGSRVKILSPERVKEAFLDQARDVLSAYDIKEKK